MLNYKDDADLAFLGSLSSSELNELVYILTREMDTTIRDPKEFLANSREYSRFYPDHAQYWQEIAKELQKRGFDFCSSDKFRAKRSNKRAEYSEEVEDVLEVASAINSIFSFWGATNKGYKDILFSLCNKMNVNYGGEMPIAQVEQNLFLKILQNTLDEMIPSETVQLGKAFGFEDAENIDRDFLETVFRSLFNAGGIKSHKLMLMVANSVQKELFNRSLNSSALNSQTVMVLANPLSRAIYALTDEINEDDKMMIAAIVQVAYLRSLNENRAAMEQEENSYLAKINVENINL